MTREGFVKVLEGFEPVEVRGGLYQYCKDHGKAGSIEQEVQWAIEGMAGVVIFDRKAMRVYDQLVSEDLTVEECIEHLGLEVEL